MDRLAAGDMLLPSGLARALMTRVAGTARPTSPICLTSREHEVLGLLAQGMSNKQIARRMDISEHGVKRHVTNLLAKLNAPNRTLAVAVALQDGLITQ
jgi:DNA-binding NarL/FixJ family response regulator